jgi:hypothetical protein
VPRKQHTVRKHRDAMADPMPFADQYAARRDLCGSRLGWCSPSGIVFCCALEQAAGGGFKVAKLSFLQPVGYGLKQKRVTDANRDFGAVEHPPALLEGSGVQSAELGEFVRQALGSRS